MNRICSVFLASSLRTKVLKHHQVNAITQAICYSTTTPKNVTPEISQKRTTKVSPKITLISDNDKIDVMTLDQAKKLSVRRDLKLVKIMDLDTKTHRAVYKLMTGSEYYAEDLKKREERKLAKAEPHIKGEKLLTIANKISQHDLNSKISTCLKWLQKYYEVRVVITGSENEIAKSEKIVVDIETQVGEIGSRIMQKRIKDGTIKFSILPMIKKEPPLKDDKKKVESLHNYQQIRSFHSF